MEQFEEKKAIAAMRAALDAEASARINDDELLNILDIIWDWYDESGMLDVDADPDGDDEIDTTALIAHVRKMLAKDKLSPVTPAEAETLVLAELAYENSLDSF